jgi:hypothetical protein
MAKNLDQLASICSHTAFQERPLGTHGLTALEFYAFNAERRRIAKIKANERSVAFRQKARASNLQGYLDSDAESDIDDRVIQDWDEQRRRRAPWGGRESLARRI